MFCCPGAKITVGKPLQVPSMAFPYLLSPMSVSGWNLFKVRCPFKYRNNILTLGLLGDRDCVHSFARNAPSSGEPLQRGMNQMILFLNFFFKLPNDRALFRPD